jgi:hypothetical protein
MSENFRICGNFKAESACQPATAVIRSTTPLSRSSYWKTAKVLNTVICSYFSVFSGFAIRKSSSSSAAKCLFGRMIGCVYHPDLNKSRGYYIASGFGDYYLNKYISEVKPGLN